MILLHDVLAEIKWFLPLVVAMFLATGVPMVMLDLNRDEAGDLIEEHTGSWVLDSLLSVYLLALGFYKPNAFLEGP